MKRRVSVIALLAACCAILVIAAIAPLSHPCIPMNHMRTARSVVQSIAAERQYAARFPAAGFTCDLRQLAQSGMVDKVLASGEKAGYQEFGGLSFSLGRRHMPALCGGSISDSSGTCPISEEVDNLICAYFAEVVDHPVCSIVCDPSLERKESLPESGFCIKKEVSSQRRPLWT